MPLKSQRSRKSTALRYLAGKDPISDDSSDEELKLDHKWQWIYDNDNNDDVAFSTKNEGTPNKKRKASGALLPDSFKRKNRIVGARMGNEEYRVGDVVRLKSDIEQDWLGILCDFDEEESAAVVDPEGSDSDASDMETETTKVATFLWFSTPREIRNDKRRKTEVLENEIYITADEDVNSLDTINGKATVVSPEVLLTKYPNGQIPKRSKDKRNLFVCRMGANTRTATYTKEFDWNGVYRGVNDIADLRELVKSQTKATRKKGWKRKDVADFVVDDKDEDEDGNLPKTPSKRRRLADSATPKSKKDTPREKFSTPTHKRIVTKKPLEFTPLGTRILSPAHTISSPFQIARTHLHVSSVPASLPCREEEFSTVYNYLESAITDGTGSCIYISGTPGTGKTATVREVVAQLNASVQAEELDDFIFVEINGMKVTDPHQSYALLWEALTGYRVSPTHALSLLEREFSTPSPRRVPCVVLMDELDQLVTKNQNVMYNFFNWPNLRHSRLIVLAVANTMDLPERTLSNKISSRLGLTRITFPGYTHSQLVTIIQSRLEGVPGNIVDSDAVQFASRKVAQVSGDARRALDICRRAVEIAESEAETEHAGDPDTPSKTGRGKDPNKRAGRVTIQTIRKAIQEATSSPLQQYLRRLPLASKTFLAGVMARTRRTGISECILGDVVDEAKKLGAMSQVAAIDDFLLCNTSITVAGKSGDLESPKKLERIRTAAPRIIAMGDAAMELVEAGIIAVEARRGERTGRVRLNVVEEEIKLALKDDSEVKGLGFSS